MNSNAEPTGAVRSESPTSEENAEILRRRAIELAKRPVQEVEEERLQVVALSLNGERYALETGFVREAIRRPRVARLPGAEPPVLGVSTWRGDLLTVFDARQLLSLPTAAAEVKDPILLVLGDGQPVGGMLVDRVEGVLAIAPRQFHATSHGGSRDEFIRGTGPDGLALLDGGRIVQSLS